MGRLCHVPVHGVCANCNESTHRCDSSTIAEQRQFANDDRLEEHRQSYRQSGKTQRCRPYEGAERSKDHSCRTRAVEEPGGGCQTPALDESVRQTVCCLWPMLTHGHSSLSLLYILVASWPSVLDCSSGGGAACRMPVLPRRPAPFFKAEAVNGFEFQTVSLDDYKGKWLVLFFYPYDFTFVCPTEVRSGLPRHSAIEANASYGIRWISSAQISLAPNVNKLPKQCATAAD